MAIPDPTHYQRDAAFTPLQPYDLLAGLDDFMEVTHWFNAEGFDVQLSTKSGEQRFSLSWGEYAALLILVPPGHFDD